MTPIQESELLLPTAEHIREAEELLPCAAGWPLAAHVCKDGKHDEDCPAYYRRTIARYLASRDAKHALDIAGRDAEIERLRVALRESGKEQIWIDGFEAAIAVASSVRILVHGKDVAVSKDEVLASLNRSLARTALKQNTPAS